MNKISFEGEIYNDDRMFVLYVCKCTVEVGDNTIATTIYHEKPPENYKWCVVTYRNVRRYRAVKVDHFETENDSRTYIAEVEPTVPLISLEGRSPDIPLSYDKFLEWKEKNGFKEYDYKKMFSMPGGSNPQEQMISRR